MCRAISLVDRAVWVASAFTSEATTAKPLPASPARAASIVAFNASRLVLAAISPIMSATAPMRATWSFSASIVVRVSLPAATARPTIALDWATWLPISRIEALSCSAALATVCALANACAEAVAALWAELPVRAAEALISSAVAVMAAVRTPTSFIALVVSTSILSTMPTRAACFSASDRARAAAPPPRRERARRHRGAAAAPAPSDRSDRSVRGREPHCPTPLRRCDASHLSGRATGGCLRGASRSSRHRRPGAIISAPIQPLA